MKPYSAKKVISNFVKELQESYQDEELEYYLDVEIAKKVNMSSSDLIDNYNVYVISRNAKLVYELAKVQINLQKLREKIDARNKKSKHQI